jgi:hypothetical protein
MTQEGKRKIIDQIESAFKPFRCVVQTPKARNELASVENFNFVVLDENCNRILRKEIVTFNHVRHMHYLEVHIQNWRYEVRKKGNLLDKHPLDEE